MNRVLLLNATFEPLCAVSGRRAVVLLLKGKAEVLEGDGRAFHSERLTIPIPSVIRLSYYVKVPYYGRANLSRRAVLARDRWKCQYCGAVGETVDHVIPRSRGGPHTWENVVAACKKCNGQKRDKRPAEAGLALKKKPGVPRGPVTVSLELGQVRPEWEPYLEYCSSHKS
ncbi:MAG: HNH endonuclease [Actinobacteria bacterium]|nr:HNH endonuclease [Actinomycetota bacterium]